MSSLRALVCAVAPTENQWFMMNWLGLLQRISKFKSVLVPVPPWPSRGGRGRGVPGPRSVEEAPRSLGMRQPEGPPGPKLDLNGPDCRSCYRLHGAIQV